MSTTSLRPVRSTPVSELSTDLLLKLHTLMVKARVLEERLIQMYKQGDGYFWIGGPGEEAFNVPLGLLIDKGQGLAVRLPATSTTASRARCWRWAPIPSTRCGR